MTGQRCAVAICNSFYDKRKKENVSFFTFPKNDDVRKRWIVACKRQDHFNPNTSRICSLHFKEDDFELDYRSSLLGVEVKRPRILKPTAVPAQNLTPDQSQNGEFCRPTSSRSTRMEKRNLKGIVNDMLAEDVEHNEVAELEMEPEMKNEESRYDILLKNYNSITEECKKLKEQHKLCRNEIENYKKRIEQLEKNNLELSAKLNKKQDIALKDRIKEMFTGILSENQLDVAVNKKKYVKWSPNDISNAFTIRYLSKRCYIYLREKMNFPLPGISSLQRWASNLSLRQGILPDVLNIMNVTGQNMSDFEKTTVLSFDEMKIASTLEYDQKEDEIVGPHSYMQVVMARGLFAKWKQAIYIGFDCKLNQALLEKIITKLHDINYKVVACVSDCGGGIMGLWKELAISTENTVYKHPLSNDPIYFFADAPHLLKLIRNWFLDNGFILENGDKISIAPVEELIKTSDTEISSCHKLNNNHVQCEKTKRQNVLLATQLLSHTTATALKRYKPGPDKKLAEATGDFIELINSWFDVFNSYNPTESIPTKMPFGKQLENQNEILNKMETVMTNSLCIGKHSLQTFQKAVIISIKSLRLLYNNMVQHHNIKYILTHRLNQDLLENLFSQIRTRGGLHDHPSPLNCIYRIRMIILGKNPGVIQRQTNTTDQDEDEFILAKAMNKAKITIPESSCLTPELDDCNTVPNDDEHNQEIGMTGIKQSEEDGLEYVAGYIANKYKDKYPHLGTLTHKIHVEHDYTIPSWVRHLSYRGLILPSDTWLQMFKNIVSIFKIFHGVNSIQQGKNILKRTTNFIASNPSLHDVPTEILQTAVKTIFFIRIKYLNSRPDGRKRKRLGLDGNETRQINKKYKKIIN